LEKIIAECWQVFGKEIPKKYKEKIAELEVNNKFLEERLESDNKKIVELLIKVADLTIDKTKLINVLTWCVGKLDEKYIEAISQEDKHTEILNILAEMKKGE
jgi:biotin carboxylase